MTEPADPSSCTAEVVARGSGSESRPSFEVGEFVRIRDEDVLSVVVLPTHRPPDDVPEDLPELFICCVPIALVRTPAEDGDLRWVELRDLTRASDQEPDDLR